MKIKKIICLLVAALVAFGLAACGGDTNIAMDKSGSVGSNGGFVVETGEYVYFINGIETYSTAYETGKVVKGALMRAKKSDFGDIGTDKWSDDKSETVVSKLIVSGDYTAGFYIYGDYVYYAVPSTEKDTTGKVKSDKLNFFRTKLDGTSTSSKITSEDYASDVSFRYAIGSGDKVYLAVYSTSLFVYDAETGKKVYSYESTKEPIDELLFDEDNGSSLYFTFKPINENLYDKDSDAAQQASYQNLYKYTLGEEDKTLLLSGKGKYIVGDDHKLEEDNDALSFTGVTIDLLTHKGGNLYFSYTNLDTTVGGTVYLKMADDKKAWADAVVLNGGDKNASTIFADGSYYYTDGNGKLHIFYISSTHGLMDYDYQDREKGDFGVNNLYYSSVISGCTILGVYGDYLYAYDSSNVYYQYNLAAILSGDKNGAEETRINRVALNDSWYKPEVLKVGGKVYLFGVYSDSVYASYCYAIDIAAEKAAYDKYLEENEEDEYYEDAVTADELKVFVEQTRLGKMTDDDKTTYTEYYDGLTDSGN